VKIASIAVAAAAALIGPPVLAADLAVEARPAPPAPPAPVHSWTACYLGGNIGGAWQRNHTLSPVPAPPTEPVDTGGDSGSGIIGGVQVGCDYQLARSWVAGIQGMFDWTNVQSSHLYAGVPTETLGINTKWVDTLTGRIGYTVWPQALLYLKGGTARAHINYSDTDPTAVSAGRPYIGQANLIRVGWTVGGGVEYAFLPNWSAFAEYNYIDLGNRDVWVGYVCSPALCPAPNPFRYIVSHIISEVLFGINYRLGWLAGR